MAKDRQTSLASKLISGGVAGVIGVCIVFPLDTVKTRLQNQKGGGDSVHIVQNEGLGGFYRGIAPNLVGIAPEKAIKLAVNENIREVLANWVHCEPANLPLRYGIAAGAVAGVCQVVATNPMEVVKIQMQLASVNNRPGQPRQTASGIARELGLRGLYRNAGATLIRDVTFSVLFFPGFAYVKLFLDQYMIRQSKSTAFNPLISGTLVGGLSAAICTPTDVIKTRLQAKQFASKADKMSYIQCLRTILQKEGVGALFKGAVPRSLTVAPMFAISMAVFDILHKYHFV